LLTFSILTKLNRIFGSKFPKKYLLKILIDLLKQEAKKWQDRKEVIDALLTILQKNPRLVVTDYYELVNDLKKVNILFDKTKKLLSII
jgi:hypothetical protein